MRWCGTRICASVAVATLAAGCAGSSAPAVGGNPRATPAGSPSQANPAPSLTPSPGPSTTAESTAPRISASAFGMHFLDWGGRRYPVLPFGSARVWDMQVTWADLQPARSTPLDSHNAVLRRLDAIVDGFRRHGVDPVLTLGMTPAWAARRCRHTIRGIDWGSRTCAPRDTSRRGPWGSYIRALAVRYDGRHGHGRVRNFELWNEPSLHNGYNDDLATLAAMQVTAATILHGSRDALVSPSIPFTNGPPSREEENGLAWLDAFLAEPGGHDFDIFGVHLYPSDSATRAGHGPEWAAALLEKVRAVAAEHSVGPKPIWDTEVNVGRVAAGITFSGASGAAQLARTFILHLESGVQRTIWYAADDRGWAGVWVEQADYYSLTPAGVAESFLYRQLVGAQPLGCRNTGSLDAGRYTCTFKLTDGRLLLAIWATGNASLLSVPKNAVGASTVTGNPIRLGRLLQISDAPSYVMESSPP